MVKPYVISGGGLHFLRSFWSFPEQVHFSGKEDVAIVEAAGCRAPQRPGIWKTERTANIDPEP